MVLERFFGVNKGYYVFLYVSSVHDTIYLINWLYWYELLEERNNYTQWNIDFKSLIDFEPHIRNTQRNNLIRRTNKNTLHSKVLLVDPILKQIPQFNSEWIAGWTDYYKYYMLACN